MQQFRFLVSALFVSALFPTMGAAFDYPGPVPGKAQASQNAKGFVLRNDLLEAEWTLENGRPRWSKIADRPSGARLSTATAELFVLHFADGKALCASDLSLRGSAKLLRAKAEPGAARLEDRFDGHRIEAVFAGEDDALRVDWSATLRDGSNYITTRLKLTAGPEGLALKETMVADIVAPAASVMGVTQGSPIVAGSWFLACEHPLANNRVEKGRALCGRTRPPLEPGQSIELTSVVGVTPPGQLRRGFLYYLERRRARPYRPFLHYNSWYHLNIGRPDNHMTEAECLDTIERFGRELTSKRRVEMDAFVWDDGWDDFNALWEFHDDFPDGFKNLNKAAKRFGVGMGVWMSPWGGYGVPKQKRVAFGKSQGYETNAGGFSMAGAKYGAAFRDVCLKMMREHGVKFFKFDGMGGGNFAAGAQDVAADDVDAVFRLTGVLRRENPDVFISATVGTWPSPFWTFHADSVWRQGGDTGFYGVGNMREQWITYRDKFACERIARRAPLYPFNSLMLHGPCIGERENPGRMPLDEASVRSEIRSFFGSGTGLQELYISPHLLTDAMWDDLGAAARWSRQNRDVLVDSHWIGGNPGELDVYGWGAWRPGKGAITLRNPSDESQAYLLDVVAALDLPRDRLREFDLKSPYPNQRIQNLRGSPAEPVEIALGPFETVVFDATPAADSRVFDYADYAKSVARRGAKQIERNVELEKQFTGVWEYTYQGGVYRREFLPDGRARLIIGGEPSSVWAGFTWKVRGKNLIVLKPNGESELHRLKGADRLSLPLDLGVAERVAADK